MSAEEPRPRRKRLARRIVLAGAAVSAVAAPVFAQRRPGPPAHPRGPRVFLDYDQVELDAAYDQAVYAPNENQILKRYASNSEVTRSRLGAPERFAYGPEATDQLDLYRVRKPRAPIHVFVHGGAWRGGSARDYGFPADMFTAAGAHLAVLDFASVQQSNGFLAPMVAQVRRAIAWIFRNAPRLGADRNRIFVSGHSSGAHLAAMALTSDWNDHAVPRDVIKGGICISGIYDLKPVRLSRRATYIRFDDVLEQALSPIRHLDKLGAPVIIAYGDYETPEFQRQAREFAAAIKASGKPVELILGQNYNHYELLETLANPQGLIGHVALAQMKLGPA